MNQAFRWNMMHKAPLILLTICRIYAFALNIDIQKESDANKRLELGKACLKALEIL